MREEKCVYWMVAHHKKDPFLEISKKFFHPIQVGKAIAQEDLGIEGDDKGDNISHMNKQFCELTAYYYAWKNRLEEFEYIGLMHYRRIFVKSWIPKRIITLNKQNLEKKIAKSKTFIENKLAEYEVVLPRKIKFGNITIRQQYADSHFVEDFDNVMKLVVEKEPKMAPIVEKFTHSNSMYAFNMLIARRDIFADYCEWLFDILFEFEKRFYTPKNDPYQDRIFGFLAERLLNIYFSYRKPKIYECPVGFINF